MLGHKSTRNYHDLSKNVKVSFAAGVEASLNHERIQRENAIANKARVKVHKEAQQCKDQSAIENSR